MRSITQGEEFPAGQDTESGGQTARGWAAWARALEETREWGDRCQQAGRLLGPALKESGDLQQAGGGRAGWSRETSLRKRGVGAAS